MITIGQLAAYAGVTIKAIRHYHQRGLLAEPPRDSSDYRRYRAEDAIELVKITEARAFERQRPRPDSAGPVATLPLCANQPATIPRYRGRCGHALPART
jgi:MerR family regulatory protein